MRFDPLAFAIAAIAIGGITALVAAFRALAARRGGALADRLAEPTEATFGTDPFPTLLESSEPGSNWLTRLLESLTRFARPMGEEATRPIDERAKKFLTGEGETIGLPEIRPDRNVELTKLGAPFSKTYYIQQATHKVDGSGYRTRVKVKETTL